MQICWNGTTGVKDFVITRISRHFYSYAVFDVDGARCGTFRDDRVDCAKQLAQLIKHEGAHFLGEN